MESSIQFNFFVPTDMVFGRGSLGKLPDLPEVNGRRCMLFCFPGFNRTEVLTKLKQNSAHLIQADRAAQLLGIGDHVDQAGLQWVRHRAVIDAVLVEIRRRITIRKAICPW